MLADVLRNPKFGFVFSFILGVGMTVILMHRECKGDAGDSRGCKRMKAPVPSEVQENTYIIGMDCYKFKTKQVTCPAADVIESFKQDFRTRGSA
jgi:hypothetical protein